MSEANHTLPLDASLSVLVVDDDSSTRKIIVETIRSLGVNVFPCEDGRDALAALKRQHFDAVVSDLMMPKMSGMMLLHSMLEIGKQIPFVFVTGFADKESAIQALRLGAFDYLEKPFEAEDLRAVVVEALRVSCEQQAMMREVKSHGHSLGKGVENRSAEIQIMKMRAFRFKSESLDFAIANGNELSWNDLKTLFVQEAEPQLVFCEAAVRGLKSSENRANDMVFLQRVVQSVRMASEAIRVNDIAEFAWSLESCLFSLKAKPELIADDHIVVLVDAVTCLKARITSLASEHATEVQKKLDRLTEALNSEQPLDLDPIALGKVGA